MEIYVAIKIKSTDEALMGLLSFYDFESFFEEDDSFTGYLKKSTFETYKEEILATIHDFNAVYSVEEIMPQNWNALWEANFQPVVVGDFCRVRADFHPADEQVQFDLIINPKMAFGTGHHATTHMMIDQMSAIDFKGRDIFDFGCGTGILAILASKLGAKTIDAVDIEDESYLNTIENAAVNGVKNITAYKGDIDVVPERKYDIILANINRNILIKNVETLTIKSQLSSVLLLSGILEDDKDKVIECYESYGWQTKKTLVKDGWVCIRMQKI